LTSRVFITIFIALTLLSCNKINQDAIVAKNCSGTTISVNDKNYRVCNEEILEDYMDGESVEISFSILKNGCPEFENGVVCDLFLEYKQWIEIKKVKSTLES
jgi:hypothetical protein